MFRILIACLLMAFPSCATESTLSLCAIFQDEARFLSEWIDFHESVGVEHFYLYNNLSHDNYKEVLFPYIDRGLVTLIEWPARYINEKDWIHIHVATFNDALKRCNSKWLLGIDVDEFVYPVQCKTLTEFLKDYNSYACVSACWVMYGTSKVDEVPYHGIVDHLIYRAPLSHKNNRTVKSFVQPHLVSHFSTSHYGHPKKGFPHFQVNEDKVAFNGMVAPYFTANKIRINHYWTRDEKFLHQVKIPRREKWGGSVDPALLNELNEVLDDGLKTFLDSRKG